MTHIHIRRRYSAMGEMRGWLRRRSAEAAGDGGRSGSSTETHSWLAATPADWQSSGRWGGGAGSGERRCALEEYGDREGLTVVPRGAPTATRRRKGTVGDVGVAMDVGGVLTTVI